MSECGEEGEDHSAADEQIVGTVDEVVDDAEFVRDLRTAEDDGERACRVVEQPVADFDFCADERPGIVREESGDVIDRGLLAVDDAESVGDEVVGQRGQLGGEFLTLRVVLRGLSGIEAQVFQQQHVTVGQGCGLRLRIVTDGVGGEGDRTADGVGEFGDDRGQ